MNISRTNLRGGKTLPFKAMPLYPVLLTPPLSQDRLDATAIENGDCFIELPTTVRQGLEGSHPLPQHILNVVRECTDFSIILTSMLAHGLRLARPLCLALKYRTQIADSLLWKIETAVHECASNAFIHGNLGLSSPTQLNMQEYTVALSAIDKTMTASAQTERYLCVGYQAHSSKIECYVSSEGMGFDFETVLKKLAEPADIKSAAGRGLRLVQNIADDLSFFDGGRSVKITFLKP